MQHNLYHQRLKLFSMLFKPFFFRPNDRGKVREAEEDNTTL